MRFDVVKLIRFGMAALCLAVGVSLLAQLFGAHVLGCGVKCGTAENLWFSPFLVGAVLIFSLADLAVLSIGTVDQYRKMAFAQGVAGLMALGISVDVQVFCPLCLAVQITWIAMAVEAIDRRVSRGIAFAMFASALYVFVAAPRLALAMRAPAEFGFRSYEGRIVGSPGAVVVFTDPLCPWCRADANQLDEGRVPLPVLHRWLLLPQHGPNAVKIAALIESAKANDYAKGKALERAISAGPIDASKADLIADGKRAGFDGQQVADWFDRPEATSLAVIRKDGDLASQLGIREVPCACFVDTIVGAGGPPQINQISGPNELRGMSQMLGKDFSGLNVYLQSRPQENK